VPDGYFDFGRDRDLGGMDPKTSVSRRDRSRWDFLGDCFGIFRDFLGFQNKQELISLETRCNKE
jgi:hypothetical protein